MMKCQSNFAFKKNDVKAALEMIDSEKRNDPETAWNLPEKEKAEWITRSDLRFRTMARHMAQNKLKKPHWYTKLVGGMHDDDGNAENVSDDARDSGVAQADESDYTYSFHKEFGKPYRVRIGDKKGLEDFGEIAVPSLSAARTDPVVGMWKDGTTHPIKELTVERYLLSKDGAGAVKSGSHPPKPRLRKKTGGTMSSFTAKDNSLLKVAKRSDGKNGMMIVLNKGARYLCGVYLSKLDFAKDATTLGVKIMETIAKKVEQDEMTMSAMRTMRDKLISAAKTDGIADLGTKDDPQPTAKKPKVVMKKPAGKTQKNVHKKPATYSLDIYQIGGTEATEEMSEEPPEKSGAMSDDNMLPPELTIDEEMDLMHTIMTRGEQYRVGKSD